MDVLKSDLEEAAKQAEYWKTVVYFMYDWRLREQEEPFAEKLKMQGIRRVAVYGMTKLGWILCNDLMAHGLEVVGGIDRRADELSCNAYSDIPDVELFLPDEEFPEMDLLIVTLLKGSRAVVGEMQKKCNAKVAALIDMIPTVSKVGMYR